MPQLITQKLVTCCTSFRFYDSSGDAGNDDGGYDDDEVDDVDDDDDIQYDDEDDDDDDSDGNGCFPVLVAASVLLDYMNCSTRSHNREHDGNGAGSVLNSYIFAMATTMSNERSSSFDRHRISNFGCCVRCQFSPEFYSMKLGSLTCATSTGHSQRHCFSLSPTSVCGAAAIRPMVQVLVRRPAFACGPWDRGIVLHVVASKKQLEGRTFLSLRAATTASVVFILNLPVRSQAQCG